MDVPLDLIPGYPVLILALQPGSLLCELIRQYPLHIFLLGLCHPEVLRCLQQITLILLKIGLLVHFCSYVSRLFIISFSEIPQINCG